MKNFLRHSRLSENLIAHGNLKTPGRKFLYFFSSIIFFVSSVTKKSYNNKFYKLAGLPLAFLIFFLVVGNTGKAQVVINEVGIAPTGGDGTGGEFIELFYRSACAQ